MTLNEITAKLGIEPNEMQKASYDAIFSTSDHLVILSPTGSGKTLAYLMPVTQQVDEKSEDLQAIVVVPGRELALQSAMVLKNMGMGLRACACYGGRPAMAEHRVLRQVRPQFIFGTPGRLNDHIDKGNIATDKIKFVIIDEFDKCLGMGFLDEMTVLMHKMPAGARRIFLSATDAEDNMEKEGVRQEGKKFVLAPELSYRKFTKLDYREKDKLVSDRIKVFAVNSPSKDKLDTLERLLVSLGDGSTIVFLNYRDSVERTSAFLREKGFVISSFHGGLDQRQREDQLFRFSNGSANIMVSTDLGSRGLDIPGIENIIHYHLPDSEDGYIHRVGRSARWDKKGRTFFLLSDGEQIPDYVDANVVEYIVPDDTGNKKPLPKMSTLYIGKGKKDKISKGDVVGFLCKIGGLKATEIGRIDIRDYYTYVAVKREKLRQVIQQTNGEKIKGQKTVIEEIR